MHASNALLSFSIHTAHDSKSKERYSQHWVGSSHINLCNPDNLSKTSTGEPYLDNPTLIASQVILGCQVDSFQGHAF